MKEAGKGTQVAVDEVEVLEDEQCQANRQDAQQQEGLSFPALRLLNPDAGEVVDYNKEGKDEYVGRDEDHVEYTACHQQQQRSVPVGQKEVENCYGRKEDQKRQGIKEHLR